VCRDALIPRQRNLPWGSGTAEHSALLNAVLCAVHAGGEQGWESDHLEPLLFCPSQFCLVTSPIVLPHWKHSLANGIGSSGSEGECVSASAEISSEELG